MSLSDYYELELLDHLMGKGSFTMLTTLHIGLSTADPGEDGAGIAEPAGNGYARVAVPAATWNAASAGVTTNAAAITFPEASGAWGHITHFVLFDALTAGHVLASGELTVHQDVVNLDTVQFAIGAISVTLT